ncbi:MAG: hypothetical protein GY861_08100 [bacterium]|nr:hypothetical protein [bacterium]
MMRKIKTKLKHNNLFWVNAKEERSSKNPELRRGRSTKSGNLFFQQVLMQRSI